MKCNHQNEFGNFCSKCGVPLKEKCAECGEMETMGRRICNTKRLKANTKLTDYEKRFLIPKYKKIILIPVLAPMFIFFGGLSLSLHLIPEPIVNYASIAWSEAILFLLLAGLTFWRLEDWHEVKRKQYLALTLKNFFELHPEYKEILKYDAKGEIIHAKNNN